MKKDRFLTGFGATLMGVSLGRITEILMPTPSKDLTPHILVALTGAIIIVVSEWRGQGKHD